MDNKQLIKEANELAEQSGQSKEQEKLDYLNAKEQQQ